MEVRFLGPLGKVTGSCTWMRDKARNWNFLIDCGMQQGELFAKEWNQCDWPFVPAELKFVVLTHAHIDHSGLLPALYKQGFDGTVYCTRETRNLAKILLNDAASFPDAIFTKADIERIKWHEPGTIPLLGGWHSVDNDLRLRFFRSGHIMGSVSVSVYWGPVGSQKSIAFSGDLGPSYEDAEYLPFMRFNMQPDPCNFAVVESTYGAVARSSEEQDAEFRRGRLRALIDRTIEQNGSLMIPAFSLGRTQDLLFDLHWIVAENPGRYAAVKFLLDSPAASSMHPILFDGFARTESNGKHGKVRPLWLGKQFFRCLGLDDKDPSHISRTLNIIAMTFGLKQQAADKASEIGNNVARDWRPIMCQIKDRHETLKGRIPTPSVIVVSSGSCDGGPAAAWLPALLGSDNHTIALSGYCSPTSVGGQLISLKDVPNHERARNSGSLSWSATNTFAKSNIKATIEVLSGYSAHADQAGLLDWLFKSRQNDVKMAGSTVFIQHGSDSQRSVLADAALRRARKIGTEISIFCPNCPNEWFDLEHGGQVLAKEQRRRKLKSDMERLLRELEEVEA